jgi:hypothetical protein
VRLSCVFEIFMVIACACWLLHVHVAYLHVHVGYCMCMLHICMCMLRIYGLNRI